MIRVFSSYDAEEISDDVATNNNSSRFKIAGSSRSPGMKVSALEITYRKEVGIS